MNQSEFVVVGRFGRPHGIKGFITVLSFTQPRDNLLQYTNWHGFINKQWQPLNILHIEMNHKHILATVEGYASREKVAELTNVDIAIFQDALPELAPGEYYWHQLIGMQVTTKDGEILGQVIEIMPTGSNDVLVVMGEKRHLIPYLIDQFVINIDAANRIITVDWDTDF